MGPMFLGSLLLPGAGGAPGKSGEQGFGENAAAAVDGSFPGPGTGWCGAQGHGDVQQDSPALLEEGLLPPTPVIPTVLSHPGSQQLLPGSREGENPGISGGSSAWGSTAELAQKERERGLFSPSWLPAWQNAAVTLPCRSQSKRTTFELPGLCRL